MTITVKEWNMMLDYLMNGKEGDYVEYAERRVYIEDMAGGCYLLCDTDGVVGLTENMDKAILFLKGYGYKAD